MPSPLTITIDDLSQDGRGVGRIPDSSNTRGKACFVAGALPGERVRWRQTGSKGSYNEGEVIEVIQASSDRVEPRCEYVQRCGGCQLQHLDADAQPRHKEQHLKKLFQRNAIQPNRWLEPLRADPWGYRRRTRLAVSFSGSQLEFGYRSRRSNDIVQIDACSVLEPRLNELIHPLRELLAGLKSSGLIEVELVSGDHQVAVCLVFKSSKKSMLSISVLDALKRFCSERAIQLWRREKNEMPARIDGGESDMLSAEIESQLGIQFRPGQFIQVNAEMNRRMIAQALELLDVSAEHSVLDLFCGAGNFSLPIALRASSVLGVEGLRDLTDQAQLNAAAAGIQNAAFQVADLSKPNSLTTKKFKQNNFDRILLDPPRAGAKNLMPIIAGLKAPKLLYISCHPAALVRDASALMQAGYKLSSAGVMDMFPQTSHLEAMALFELS